MCNPRTELDDAQWHDPPAPWRYVDIDDPEGGDRVRWYVIDGSEGWRASRCVYLEGQAHTEAITSARRHDSPEAALEALIDKLKAPESNSEQLELEEVVIHAT